MKVIFVADVPSVAKVGQTKEVANGYARNYLFPRQLAVLANSNAAAAVDAHLKKLVKQHAIIEAEMSELAKKIGGMEVTIRAKVGENDKLYGSVGSADVAEAISKAAGREIDKKLIVLAEPIKMAGVTDVTIRFMHEITAVIKVNVVDENATEETIKAQKKAKADKAAAAAAAEKAAAAEEKAVKPAKAEKVPAEKAAAEKPAKEKKAKAEKATSEKPAKEAVAEVVKEEKPAKAEKAPAEKKAKAEKAASEKPAKEAAVQAVKEEKPAKEKKAKAEKAAPAEAVVEEKKEKKPKAKAKKDAE